MIISGGKRAFWRKFAPHLMKDENGQQQVRIVEIRGLAADNVTDAFHELEALGRSTRAKNFYYHANIDPRADEHMTEEQWEYAVDLLEKNLGLTGQERFVVEHYHEDDGRTHRHVVWSRVRDDLKVVPCNWNYAIHQKTADQLEREFGHEKTPRQREQGKLRGPEGWEYFRGKESKIAPKEVEAEIRALWQQCDSGQALAAAIADKGYILAEGDKCLCIVDSAGHEHSLARRAGVRVKDVNARMADINRDALPSVPEARTMAREHRKGDREKRDEAQAQPDHKKRDQALEMVAEELADAAGKALKGESKEHQAADHEPPKAEAEEGKRKENAGPDQEPHEEATTEPPSDRSAEQDSAPAQANTATAVPEPAPRRPASAPEPTIRRKPSLWERVARKLSEAVQALGTGPTVAEAADLCPRAGPSAIGPALPLEPSRPVLAPPAPSSMPDAFERIAHELAQEVKAAAPAADEIAAAAVTIAGPELSEFERVTMACDGALRAAGGESLFFTEGLAWLAHRLPPADAPPPGQALTPFDHATRAIHETISANGGEPEPGFWQRSTAVLTAARDRFIEWARQTKRSFVALVQRSRDRGDRDKPGLER